MISDFNADSLSIQLNHTRPRHNISSCNEVDHTYPNISRITAMLQHELTSIGTIEANLFDNATMDAIRPAEMWHECQTYDEAHAPGAKLDKVENFLANESFPTARQAQIDEAEWVLYIEEAYIEPPFRRRGLSLLALDLLIKESDVGDKCVVMLQAGSISRFENDEQSGALDAVEACEKITRHWKRMGLEEWSESDDAWLCLLTGERPKIEVVVPGLFPATDDQENPAINCIGSSDDFSHLHKCLHLYIHIFVMWIRLPTYKPRF